MAERVQKLPLAHQTMFADLSARCLDAAFDEQFPENGSFVQLRSKNRAYWYYSEYRPKTAGTGQATRRKLYVGPVDDPEISSRVLRFADIKSEYRARRKMAQSLVVAGLPSPPGLVGDVVEALWKAGFFRLRGVLIGTIAFQTYAGYLGVHMPGAPLTTSDADFAQFHSISCAVDDEMPPILDVLRTVDPSFQAVPHIGGNTHATKYRSGGRGGRFEVEFLTPNRGSDEYQGKPATMPALGGAGAEPMRFLDYLIHAPVRSVLLHKAGVPVTVPAPERYAIHKLIVAALRRDDDNGRLKAQKDIRQAELLLEALDAERRLADAGLAWMEAWERGRRWQDALGTGRRRLDPKAQALLERAILAASEAE